MKKVTLILVVFALLITACTSPSKKEEFILEPISARNDGIEVIENENKINHSSEEETEKGSLRALDIEDITSGDDVADDSALVKEASISKDSKEEENISVSVREEAPIIEEEVDESADYIDFRDAPDYVGDYKTVRGVVDHVFYSGRSDTTFINFCSDYSVCPFSSVVFKSDKSKFSDLSSYKGRTVEISGIVGTYQGRPQIILKSPSQIEVIK